MHGVSTRAPLKASLSGLFSLAQTAVVASVVADSGVLSSAQAAEPELPTGSTRLRCQRMFPRAEPGVQPGVTNSRTTRIYPRCASYVWLALCKKPSEHSSWDAGIRWA